MKICVLNPLKVFLSFFIFWFLAATTVSANELCPKYAQIQGIELDRALSIVASRMKNCSDDAIALGLYGGLLLRNGFIQDAVIFLEKSLLLDPEQKGVQADFALALSSVGDDRSAATIAGQLLTEDVPPTVDALLRDLTRIDRWDTRLVLEGRVGASDNIEYVPNLSAIELTFGEDGVSNIPLAEKSVPKSGAFFSQSFALSSQFKKSEILISPALDVTERRAAGSDTSDYLANRLGLDVSLESIGRLSTSYRQVNRGSGLDQKDLQLELSKIIDASGACQNGLGAQWKRQNFSEPNTDDATIYQLSFWRVCNNLVSWGLDVYVDRGDAGRLGGNRNGFSGQVNKNWSLDQFNSVGVQLGLSRQTDSEGYSDFLDRGNVRQISTLEGSIVWRKLISDNLLVEFGINSLRQSSNISLFDVNASEASATLRYTP